VTSGINAAAGLANATEAGQVAQMLKGMGVAGRAALGSVLTQGISVATGLQSSFSWKEVAAAAIAAPLADSIGQSVRANTHSNFAGNLAAGAAGSLVRGAVGGKIDSVTVIADAFGNALGNSIVDRMSPQPVAGSRAAGSGSVEELQEVGIAARYVGPGSEERNARLDNNPINVIRSGSDGVQLASEVFTTGPGGPEEIVVAAQRLTPPQKRLYDRLISPITQLGYGMSESAAMSFVDSARAHDIRYDGDDDVVAENNRIAINFGLTMVGGGAAGAFGAALFPTFLASTKSVLLAGAASGGVSDLAFQGYQNALFAGSEGDYGRSGIDVTELALSAGFGALPGLPAAVRGWADELRGLGVPDWNIKLAPAGTLYSNGIGLQLERIGAEGHAIARHGGAVTDEQLILRARTGIAPDGSVAQRTPDSTAFYTDGLLVEADQFLRQNYLDDAIANAAPGQVRVKVTGDMGTPVGRGYLPVGRSVGLPGPLLRVDNISQVQAWYVYDPSKSIWQTNTIYPLARP